MIINWAKAIGGFMALNFGKWFAEQGEVWIGGISAIFGIVLLILTGINMGLNIRNRHLERKEAILRIEKQKLEIERLSKNSNN